MFPEVSHESGGVSRCTEDDLGELREFQRQMYEPGSRVLDRDRSEWLFSGRPSGPGEGLTIWICRRDGKIVGTVAEIPFDVKVDDMYHRGSWGVDLMVDPRWRGRGIGPALSETRRRSCRVSAGLSISEAARKSALRRRSTEMGSVPMLLRLVEPRAILGWEGAPLVVRCLALPLAALAVWLLDRVDGTRTRGTDLVPVDAFDGRADLLWHEVSAHYPVISRRDSAWLKWRFDECPHRDAYIRYYVRDRERLIGYLVFRPTTWGGRPALSLVDYLAGPADMGRVLSSSASVARSFRASAVLCNSLNSRARNAFRKTGFFRRRNQGIRFLAYTADEALQPKVLHPERWFITSADSDLDT